MNGRANGHSRGIGVWTALILLSAITTQLPAQTTFTISGTVTDFLRRGISGVTLTATSGPIHVSVITDSAGHYSGTFPAGLSGTVRPSKAGYQFIHPREPTPTLDPIRRARTTGYPTCTSLTLSNPGIIPYRGGSGTITVTGSPSVCELAWTPSSNQSWLTVERQRQRHGSSPGQPRRI